MASYTQQGYSKMVQPWLALLVSPFISQRAWIDQQFATNVIRRCDKGEN